MSGVGGGSGGLVPSKSTVYVSNLPFSLTNNDLHKIFEKYGRVAKVTVAKDKTTRQSKGVAFVLFIERESAHRCINELNEHQMFGRTIKCSIAKDNGRATEFIRRKVYKDKARCYECGEEGHLSYACSHNLLGDREPPPKKEKKRKKLDGKTGDAAGRDSDDSCQEDPSQSSSYVELDSLSAAINYQRQREEQTAMGYDTSQLSGGVTEPERKRYKKDAYFSDEEELD